MVGQVEEHHQPAAPKVKALSSHTCGKQQVQAFHVAKSLHHTALDLRAVQKHDMPGAKNI
jgi:hypothetical protein